jgi:hypothetical protein
VEKVLPANIDIKNEIVHNKEDRKKPPETKKKIREWEVHSLCLQARCRFFDYFENKLKGYNINLFCWIRTSSVIIGSLFSTSREICFVMKYKDEISFDNTFLFD